MILLLIFHILSAAMLLGVSIITIFYTNPFDIKLKQYVIFYIALPAAFFQLLSGLFLIKLKSLSFHALWINGSFSLFTIYVVGLMLSLAGSANRQLFDKINLTLLIMIFYLMIVRPF